ncbi:MAG: winged helix DNA-binding domain-containing protein, partial [Microbacterium sp.]|nr:winged helix DNA-binding domain-containing protein [Microbacterium sp.]
MELERLRAERLRSHRLSAPATDVVAAARHMLATQAQEFWGGRWALAARTRGTVTLRDVDAAFDRGDLVRSWTMRGTIHVIPARDLRWVLSVTGDRQLRAAAARHRGLGLDAETLARCEAAIVGALRGGGRLTRAELFEVLSGIGIDPKNQRGVHVIYALAVTGVICQGPVVPREGGRDLRIGRGVRREEGGHRVVAMPADGRRVHPHPGDLAARDDDRPHDSVGARPDVGEELRRAYRRPVGVREEVLLERRKRDHVGRCRTPAGSHGGHEPPLVDLHEPIAGCLGRLSRHPQRETRPPCEVRRARRAVAVDVAHEQLSERIARSIGRRQPFVGEHEVLLTRRAA